MQQGNQKAGLNLADTVAYGRSLEGTDISFWRNRSRRCRRYLASRGPGRFPELMRYVLLDHDADSPFKWLQSLDDGTMAFVVISPLTFRPDYTVEVTEEEISILKLQSPDDAVISVIVTIPWILKR